MKNSIDLALCPVCCGKAKIDRQLYRVSNLLIVTITCADKKYTDCYPIAKTIIDIGFRDLYDLEFAVDCAKYDLIELWNKRANNYEKSIRIG
ncbi:MAG: Lar family restriction alleviation protein [Bacteroidota bacterium]|jgi:hypothetical protein